jgi:hypothetical protein
LDLGIPGVALAVAPFIFGYSSNPTALWASIILGAVVALAEFFKALANDRSKWEYWVATITGLLAFIAPFVLGFSAMAGVLWSMVVLGGLVAILAGYEVFQTPEAATQE